MKNMGRARQIFLTAGLFPVLFLQQIWAAFSSTPTELLVLTALMLLLSGVIVFVTLGWGRPSYLDWAVAAYFAAVALSLLFRPAPAFRFLTTYPSTGIYFCFFAAAFLPPLFGRDPFTCHYARKRTPAAHWKSAVFLRINLIMTYVWAGIFAISILLSLYPSPWTRTIAPVLLMLGLGLPFNARFPDLYLRRLGFPSLAEQRRAGPKEVHSKHSDSPLPAPDLPSGESELFRLQEPLEAFHQEVNHRQEKTMKVLALNSSPRSEGRSKTALMLSHLVRGMKEAGAEVEIVDLREKKVKNCLGCFSCWTKSPGLCIQKDDMTAELYPKWAESDLVVYASPLYHYTVNATMKAFIERTLPVVEPFFEERQGRMAHPLRRKHPAVVMLSVAGFPEDSVFGQLSSWTNHVFGPGLVAEIYRPAAEAMINPAFAHKAKEILEATAQAGREIVESMTVSSETMVRIKRPIHEDTETFLKMGNVMWKTCISEGVTPSELVEKGIRLRPDSIETFLMIMTMGFNPEGAGDMRAVLQFDFSGEVEGSCHLAIGDGKIEAFEGPSNHPTLTVQTPFHVWMDVMTGRADGQEMFMQQKYKTQGDLSLLLRMKDLFRK